jgi:hypothetical protein
MITLSNFDQHLKSISGNDWKQLERMLQLIEQTESFSVSSGFLKKGKNTFVLPSASPAPVVLDFVKLIKDLKLVPEYDWTEWKEAQLILENREEEIEGLDAVSLCKLFTVMIQVNEFADGFLLSCFSNGAVAAILRGLLSKYNAGN